MNWKQPQSAEEGAVKIPKNWLFIHYYEALTILFRLENTLRVFVYSVLKNEHFEKWTELSIASDEAQQSNIATIAKRRQAQAGNFGYLCFPIGCPIMHLTSGELIRLVLSESEWPRFKSYFLGSKEIIRTKLDEIGCIRNSLAHFRPLKPDDVDVLKQNARHALSLVESKIEQMINCPNTTPTNTTEKWYTELRTLGTEVCQLSFTQSADLEWASVMVTYKPPILKKDVYGGPSTYFRTLNLKTPSLLQAAPTIAKYVTFLTELAVWPGDTTNPEFAKHCSFLFKRSILREKHAEIKKELEDLLRRISEETELIKQDNLAAGSLIETCQVSFTMRQHENQNYPQWSLAGMRCPISDQDLPEYWGETGFFVGDYITSIPIFPWMPTAFAQDDYF